MKKSLIVAPLLILTLIAGCNQKPTPTPPPADTNKEVASTTSPPASPAPESNPTPTPTPPASAGKDLCALLTAEEVSEILGYSVKIGELNMPSGETVTGCHYESNDTDKGYGVTMIANYDNKSVPAKTAYEAAVSEIKTSLDPSLTKFEEVTGVGEAASLTSSGFMVTLMALEGDVWISGSMAGSDANRAEIIKKVVGAALAKL